MPNKKYIQNLKVLSIKYFLNIASVTTQNKSAYLYLVTLQINFKLYILDWEIRNLFDS